MSAGRSRAIRAASRGCLVAAVVLAASCGGGGHDRDAPEWERQVPLAALPGPTLGVDLPLSTLTDPPTPARVRLGRWLFYDTRLSADQQVSCGTCHRPEEAYANRTRVATGVFGRLGTRKVPVILNQAAVLGPHFFRDGRAASLEEQAMGPFTRANEMGMAREQLVAAVARIPGYRRAFAQAFGDEQVTEARIAKAVADFERTLVAGNSAWDRWRADPAKVPVAPTVRAGDELFFGRAACSHCHVGQSFTDGRFHNLGVGWDPVAGRFADEGRGAITGRPEDRGAFKTPTLRDVALHPPYMHDGSLGTLRDVVEFYNRGGTPNPALSTQVVPLGLSPAEIDALVAFLEALTSDVPRAEAPPAFPQE